MQLTKRRMSREEKVEEARQLFMADYWSVPEVCDMTGLLLADVQDVLDELMSDPHNEVLLDLTVKDYDKPKRWKVNVGVL